MQDALRAWEQKYILRAPFDGKVQFLKFWTDNQFVQINAPIFTIVPDISKLYGQVLLPSLGAGKVKVGQDVIVKLNDYPFREYGSIAAKVRLISLTTNTASTNSGDIEAYLLEIDFIDGLKTNFDTELEIRPDVRGIAEIITNRRRLIERIFENLIYNRRTN